MSKVLMYRQNIAQILNIDRRTVAKYVRDAHIEGYPKTSRQPKYDLYKVASLFGYTKDDVHKLMKENA